MPPPVKEAKGVAHVSGILCYLCLRKDTSRKARRFSSGRRASAAAARYARGITGQIPPSRLFTRAGVRLGVGVVLWRARPVRPLLLRRRAGRPQLKRDPLGGGLTITSDK